MPVDSTRAENSNLELTGGVEAMVLVLNVLECAAANRRLCALWSRHSRTEYTDKFVSTLAGVTRALCYPRQTSSRVDLNGCLETAPPPEADMRTIAACAETTG
jgi:hypothetical protein